MERPVNVVKELVENAIDAGARAITVEIREGGKKMIRVTDNGCGIEKSQITKAFERHATSKIRDDSDLTKLVSLGFRGEALSSIAAVSQVEMITKTRDSLTGVRATNQSKRSVRPMEPAWSSGIFSITSRCAQDFSNSRRRKPAISRIL